MLGDNKDYKFFVTILALAIITSIFFHIFFRQGTEASFSEIYFPFPDGLPNQVVLGQSYNFTFLVKNNEGKPATYGYSSKLELFNLYDTTEGIYKCVAQQRKKVLIGWLYANETNETLQSDNNKITGYASYSPEPFQSPSPTTIYSQSDDYGRIDWDSYIIEYSYENLLGGGSFTTFFYNNDSVKYSFKIIYETSEVEFIYPEKGAVKSEKRKIDLNKQGHNIIINASGNTLRYKIDGQPLFNKSIHNLTDGKIGFRMDDSYILLGRMITYKDTPIQVTSSKYIREYDIDNSLIISKIEEYREASEEKYTLYRNLVNTTEECTVPECEALRSFLNNPQSPHFNISIMNETGVVSLLELNKATALPNYYITQNISASKLFWTNYTTRIYFQTFVKAHSFVISIDKSLMVVFHNQNMYFASKSEGNWAIHRRRSYVEIGVNELLLEAKDGNIVFYINKIPIFSFKKEINFKDVALYTKNTFVVFDDITVTNKDGKCRFNSISKDCKRAYSIESERRISSSGQLRIVTEPIKFSAGIALAPFIGVAGIFETGAQNTTTNRSARPSAKQLIEYEIEINRSLVNTNIPSEKYIFDGRNARLLNQTNYSFAFNFHLLEGVRLIETSFYDNTNTEISKFVINQPSSEVYLFTNHQGSVVKSTAVFNVSRYEGHKFEMAFDSDKTSYHIDNKKIFDIGGVDMSNGYLSISTYSTYADITDIRVYDQNLRRFIPYTINEDPCKLRKIDEIPIVKGPLYLGDNENKTITSGFSISKDFDYGKVSAALKQEAKNESEIHFWVVRDD